MRVREALASSACLLLVAGCQPILPAGAGRPAPGETCTHPPSGFRFPPSVGEFTRESLRQYDGQGRDVSVGYNLGRTAAMTVYVYPAGRGTPDSVLDAEFEKCKREIASHHADAKENSSGPVKISPGGRERTGRHAVFTLTGSFAQSEQRLSSELYLFVDGDWFIKYRVSYPAGARKGVVPAVAAFLKDLSWPTNRKDSESREK